MGKKSLSLIIVPHSKSNYRTISFSKKTVKGFLWGSLVIGILLASVTVDYVRMQVSRKTYRALLGENLKQKESLGQYQASIGTLNKKIDSLETYVKKLNVIAGIKSQDVLKEVGIGPVSVPGGDDQVVAAPPSQIPSGNLKSISQKADDLEKNFDTLLNLFETKRAELATMPTISPTVGWQTASFGWRTDPFTQLQQFHRGIDIAGSIGNPVVATADGIVVNLNQDKIFGRSILISHGGGLTTFYGHLNKFLVQAGQKVKRGDLIGELGNSGKATGPHVHYEVRLNDKAINPYFYILEEE
jgi:murein DD-endopeptidase MepM/ murein hydrolase activator NlpD